jgi:hypothetical protein
LTNKVVNIILLRKYNIVKVECLRNDSKKQESLISESVTVIRINFHLAREQPNNKNTHGHEHPTCGHS